MLSNVHLTRRRLLAVGSALAATALVAACGEADEELDGGGGSAAGATATPTQQPATTPTPPATAGTAGIEHPTGSEELILRIESGGGFVPVEFHLTTLPLFSLYGDGSVIVQGPQIEIYPPPALPNLQIGKLTEEGIQFILQAAEDAGLLNGDRSLTEAPVADLPTTVFTTNAGGRVSTVSIYGLGVDVDPSLISEEDLELREQVTEFLNNVTIYQNWLPASAIAEPERAYTPERLRLFTRPADEVPLDDPEITPGQVEWPLDQPIAELASPYQQTGLRVLALEGEQAATLLDALAGANTLTRWLSDGEEYLLYVRPLLPGEPLLDESSAGQGIEHPADPSEVVLRVWLEGGFVPLEWHAVNLPLVSLFGDGSFVNQGPVPAIYPGPALPNLQVTKLNEVGVQLILQEAAAAGLLDGNQHYPYDMVADAGTTVFATNAGGQSSTVSVYALGIEVAEGDLPAEEIEARQRLLDFYNRITGAPYWLPEEAIESAEQPYEIHRLQVIAQPESAVQSDPEVEPNELEWPLSTPLSELGEPAYLEMSRCFVVEGEDLTVLLGLLDQATQITRWLSDGERYLLYLRPLLPDEPSCPDPFF
jgi:hypothetical protein